MRFNNNLREEKKKKKKTFKCAARKGTVKREACNKAWK